MKPQTISFKFFLQLDKSYNTERFHSIKFVLQHKSYICVTFVFKDRFTHQAKLSAPLEPNPANQYPPNWMKLTPIIDNYVGFCRNIIDPLVDPSITLKLSSPKTV